MGASEHEWAPKMDVKLMQNFISGEQRKVIKTGNLSAEKIKKS